MQQVRIRPATAEDRLWVLPLSARLHDFGPPPWRPREQMDQAVATALETALTERRQEARVLVAEDEVRTPLGFVHMHEAQDFFTGETHCHVSDLVVTPLAEDRGVGRALMAAAESWARQRGHRLITLNVFAENHRARGVYSTLGFAADTVKMIKVLAP